MKRLVWSAYKRLVVHWKSTVKGILLLIALWMFVNQKITVNEIIAFAVFVQGADFLGRKDSNKVPTKPQYQRPDPL